MSKQKQPNWTRDELILGLDVYLNSSNQITSQEQQEIYDLSDLLRALPIHEDKDDTFRNPTGVFLTLYNFTRYALNTGQDRGGKLQREVWDELSEEPQTVRKLAEIIRNNIEQMPTSSATIDLDEEYINSVSEGNVVARLHLMRERNAKIIKAKKKAVLKRTGKLACEACEFDFAESYGALGHEFAECHHEKPVSEMASEDKTKLSDLRIVCSNCHRMLHRTKPVMTVEALKELLNR